ncbi:tetratricopeptide repeat protein [Stenotrophomonas sp. TWI273]|jgi:Flp pilus assembly protein TadD|uniref:tetratricopeptide repeat protein n=1 Tax=unclassified Stenotrophomonas TaxID=196198 RepID=UPI00320813B2
MHDAVSSVVVHALLSARSEVEAAFAGTRDADAALATATATLEAALSAHSEDPLLLTGLGAVACDRAQYARAREVLQRALALGSDDRHAAFNLGVALLNTGRTAQARAAFEQARTMAASPFTWEAWFDPQAH